ncbi:MAG: sugar ABC transporter permease YjfF [Lachnospiraceae bacterium]|nr:sugar ABC transporter permease YjfF [Lachnospiraceae bacterium]
MSKKSSESANAFQKIMKKITATNTSLLLTITIAIFLFMYLFAIIFVGGSFTKPQAFLDILNNNACLIILACGMSIVMITGGIDISVGGVVALVSMCCAVYLDKRGGSVLGAIVISLLIGLAFGAFQGFLVAYLDIQPFIVTLAGMFFARGMVTIVCEVPFNVEHAGFVALKDSRIEIPFLGSFNRLGQFIPGSSEVGVIVSLIVVVVLFVIMKWTRLGRAFYAVGGNAQSAMMLGINVRRTRFLSHLICGLMAGIGGFVYFMHVGSGSPAHATGYEMNAIAAAIIGGTMLSGGVGNIMGAFFGVLSLATIKNIVAAWGLQDAWWTGITIATMICLFLIIQSIVSAVRSNKKR